MVELPPDLVALIAQLGPEGRRKLLDALVLAPDELARRIGRLHHAEETRELAEILIDLEADPLAKGLMIEALRAT